MHAYCSACCALLLNIPNLCLLFSLFERSSSLVIGKHSHGLMNGMVCTLAFTSSSISCCWLSIVLSSLIIFGGFLCYEHMHTYCMENYILCMVRSFTFSFPHTLSHPLDSLVLINKAGVCGGGGIGPHTYMGKQGTQDEKEWADNLPQHGALPRNLQC